MRPVLLVFSAVMAATVLAAGAPALAQTREAPTLRRLDWAGRPETSGPAGLRRPAPVIPHAGAAPTQVALRPARAWRPTPGRIDGRPGLTPADAFFGPGESAAAPTLQPSRPAEPVAVPMPVRSEPAAERRLQPQPQPQPRPAPVEAAPPPAAAPQTSARLVQPSPVTVRPAPAVSQPVSPPEAAQVEADPMAPRRDAPIFRIQGARPPQGEPRVQPDAVPAPEAAPAQGQAQGQAQSQPQGQAQPYGQGARYYSVHRQAGRQPDRTPMPEQVWLDRMPIEMDRTPESEDLAAPPETPQMMRDAQGRMRPVQATATDGDLP